MVPTYSPFRRPRACLAFASLLAIAAASPALGQTLLQPPPAGQAPQRLQPAQPAPSGLTKPTAAPATAQPAAPAQPAAQAQPKAPARPAAPAVAAPAAPAPAAPAASAPQTAAPAAQAQTEQPGAQPEGGEAQATQGTWGKGCIDDPNSKKTLCMTGYEIRSQNGQLVAAAKVQEIVGEKKRDLVVAFPAGVRLKQGVKVQIDGGKPMALNYDVCTQLCVATLELNDAMLGQMKKGSKLLLSAVFSPNKGFQVPVSLGNFKQAYEGQGTDVRKVAEDRKKLEDGLQKRAQEAGQRLMQNTQ